MATLLETIGQASNPMGGPSNTYDSGLVSKMKDVFTQVKATAKGLGLDKTQTFQTAAAAVKKVKEASAQGTGGPLKINPNTAPSAPMPTGAPANNTFGGQNFENIYQEYSAEYSKLKGSSGFEFYSGQLEDAYKTLGDLRNTEDKYVATKQFKGAISKLNQQKYMLRPQLIEKYKKQGFSATDIERMVAAETAGIDGEMDALENKWQDQMKEYKSSIDGAKDEISMLTTQLRFSMDDIDRGMNVYKDARSIFDQMEARSNSWQTQQAQLVETITKLKKDGIDTSSLENYVDTSLDKNSVLNITKPFMGDKYNWGGANPVAGFDCSGLTQWVTKEKTGVTLPRTAAAQYSSDMLESVAFDQMRPGDLVYFSDPGDFRISGGQIPAGTPTHTGIITENGTIIHSSPSNPGGGVAESTFQELAQRWTSAQFLGVKRVKGKNEPAATGEVNFAKKTGENETDYQRRLYGSFDDKVLGAIDSVEPFDGNAYINELATALRVEPDKVKEGLGIIKIDKGEILTGWKTNLMIDDFPAQLKENKGNFEKTLFEIYQALGGVIPIEVLAETIIGDENIVTAMPEQKWYTKIFDSEERKAERVTEIANAFSEKVKDLYSEFFN